MGVSAAVGTTCNFENNDTDYQNGVDSHLDRAVSQFLWLRSAAPMPPDGWLRSTPEESGRSRRAAVSFHTQVVP